MQFPLTMSFKKIAFSPQISVLDANGQLQFYVKQKLFKLKEAVTVFEDQTQTKALYTIQADRIIDWSARYHFRDSYGNEIGSVKRKGRKSLWKTHYDIYEGDRIVGNIQEENTWTKVWDTLFSEIPIIGLFAGYLFNPVYLISRSDGTVIAKVKKQPAFLESKFTIEEVVDVNESSEIRTILSILMMTLLERARG